MLDLKVDSKAESQVNSLKQNEAHNACAESAHKGVNKWSKEATQTQQRPESPTVTLTWHASKYKICRCSQMEFIYVVFTRIPGEGYRRRLRSLLLCSCDVF